MIDGPVNTFVELDGIGPVVIPYMNHYLANGAAVVPVGGDPGDEPALELLGRPTRTARSSACPRR